MKNIIETEYVDPSTKELEKSKNLFFLKPILKQLHPDI